MIDKILHSFEPIDYQWRYLFDDFVFYHWDKKETNCFKVLYDHGGIFINGIRPIANFYKLLNPYQINLWECKLEQEKVTLDLSIIACERNFNGCRIMQEELKELTTMDIVNQNFKKYREAFNVLPWNTKEFKRI
ncbi:MAG: hypothetical protein CBE47_02870 [Pelagibacteraceae bacterium TMED287]|jgi:hypothetical protein|nr:MAG: hypothetical protein CBE47_02870 [Pelagibacteraceae bacterium TMED287]|tara:strand:- start:428 stop:829 length:402 start_codon:yes stop_codon:yes gene_type:complete